VDKKYDAEPETFAIQNMDKLIDTARDNLEKLYKRKLDLRVFLTADSLFREDVMPTYKKSREGVRKPTHLKACKRHLEKQYGAETLVGYEADDLMAIYATELGQKDCIIMSLDKDLDQIPGEHYNFVKCQKYTVSNKQARHNFWTQVLMGDNTDDIPGLHGVGPKTAEKILEDCLGKDDHTYYKKVVATYIARTKRKDDESDKDFLTRCIMDVGMNARLLWLCREPEQLWDVPRGEVSQ